MVTSTVSKRNSRTYMDDVLCTDDAITLRSRRNSRQEDSIPLDTMEMHVKELSPSSQNAASEMGNAVSEIGKSLAEKTEAARKEALLVAKLVRMYPPVPLSPWLDRAVPMTGGPINFGVVVPGVYRSSYPQLHDYDFVRKLGLKTVVTLVQKDEDIPYASFMTNNGIQHRVFDMRGTKKQDIPIPTMKAIMRLVLDQRNHPLLIHCNHGKHRTGCVVAVVRKVSGWELSTIVDEYKSFAEPKIRECDVKYITAFRLADISSLWVRRANHDGQRVRTFVRAVIFTIIVLAIWVFTSTQFACNNRPTDI